MKLIAQVFVAALIIGVGVNLKGVFDEAVIKKNMLASATDALSSSRCLTSGYTFSKDIAYKTVAGVDQNLLNLDIYTPQSAGSNCIDKYPVVVYVHGGGWQKGDKKQQIADKIPYFTSKGYVFVSVNYRLTPLVKYPVHNEDVAAATAFLVQNVAQYKGDPAHMIIMGHSAGGSIISSITTDERYLSAHSLPLTTYQCAVSLDTAGYDISIRAADEVDIYVNAFGTNPTVWKDASPITHVAPNKGIPSFFIVVRGTRARIQEAYDFSNKINSNGGFSFVLETPSLDHNGVNEVIGLANDTIITPKLQKFIDAKCFPIPERVTTPPVVVPTAAPTNSPVVTTPPAVVTPTPTPAITTLPATTTASAPVVVKPVPITPKPVVTTTAPTPVTPKPTEPVEVEPPVPEEKPVSNNWFPRFKSNFFIPQDDGSEDTEVTTTQDSESPGFISSVSDSISMAYLNFRRAVLDFFGLR